MKRIIYLMTALILTAAPLAWSANPSGGAITVTQDSNTEITVNITTAPAAVDSVFLCKFIGSATDTLFEATVDSADVAASLTGLTPNETATYFLLARGSAQKTALSNKVTLTMYGPETEYIPATQNDKAAMDRTLSLTEQVIRAVSWRPDNLLTTFTLDGDADSDSTGVYTPWRRNCLVVIATQAGDSVGVMLNIHYGYRVMSQTGATKGFAAVVDSLNITGPGTFVKTLTADVAAPSMYFDLQSYATNGKDAELEIYLNRDRY